MCADRDSWWVMVLGRWGMGGGGGGGMGVVVLFLFLGGGGGGGRERADDRRMRVKALETGAAIILS